MKSEQNIHLSSLNAPESEAGLTLTLIAFPRLPERGGVRGGELRSRVADNFGKVTVHLSWQSRGAPYEMVCLFMNKSVGE